MITALISALVLIVLIIALCVRVFILQMKCENSIDVSDQCDKQLITKILNLPDSSKISIENEIDAGVHNVEPSDK